jgi:predicted Zn-dependent protease
LGVSNLIIQANKPDKAIELLNNNLLTFNKDPLFFQLLAKAYNQKKEYLLEHENLSDAYYHQFDIQNAITQMDLAVKTPSENFYDKSRVEHRLNELKREAELMRN